MIELTLTNEELAHLYQHHTIPNKVVYPNNYVIITTEDDTILPFKSDTNNQLFEVSYQTLESKWFGELKPRDAYQLCYVDSMRTNELTFCSGKAGSGKSMFALAEAFRGLDAGDYGKIFLFVNPSPSKGSVELGFLPGSLHEKLLDSQIGNILYSKIGDRIYVDTLINKGVINLVPMSNARGFEVANGSFVYFTEAQNLSIYLAQLFLQRLGDGVKCVMEGDPNTQVDSALFENGQNGMRRAIEVFQSANFAADVDLKKIYRGKIALWADKM